MKQAVIKLALKAEELFKHEPDKQKLALECRLILAETMIVFRGEEIISGNQFVEAMEEIDRIYPVK
jgi:hypothetical protein